MSTVTNLKVQYREEKRPRGGRVWMGTEKNDRSVKKRRSEIPGRGIPRKRESPDLRLLKSLSKSGVAESESTP